MTPPTTVGSLFAGIGGFDLGFERAGMRTEWFVDNDPFCQAVLAKHWPGVPIHTDVRDVGAHNLPRVDVLCGGFPCQDISAAGRGAGLAGARSGLWFEFHRLIGELRPSYVVVENVPLLRTRGLDVVITGLAELGYDAEWDVVSAAEAGAPHIRKRIWIVAYPNGNIGDARWSGDSEQGQGGRDADRGGISTHSMAHAQRPGLEGHGPESGQPQIAEPRFGDSPAVADSNSAAGNQPRAAGEALLGSEAVERPGRCGRSEGSPWATEPDVGRVAHGVPARVDRLRALGNALLPQIAEWIGHRILAYEAAR